MKYWLFGVIAATILVAVSSIATIGALIYGLLKCVR